MTFQLPKLPYELDALAPYISKETLEFHYGKHHQAYVNNLNNLVKDDKRTLEEVIVTSSGPIFNNAAQIWNHTFFWNSLSPKGGGEPVGAIKDLIIRDFGSFQNFKEAFNKSALSNFGSGWTWLIQNNVGKLEIVNTSNAETPITKNLNPLLVVDIWEHAYYIDYRNNRANFLDAFWSLVNFDFANKNLK